jgi:hypothetical protein
VKKDTTDIQKHPSSLAVLVEILLALAEIFQKDPIVLQEYQWKVEEIKTDLKSTTLSA